MNRLSTMDRVRQEIALQLARLAKAEQRAWKLWDIMRGSSDRCRPLMADKGAIPQSVSAEIDVAVASALEAARRSSDARQRIGRLADLMGVTSATPEARP